MTEIANELAHPTEKHTIFGAVPRAMDLLMNFITAPVLTLLVVVGTLFAPTARALGAMRGIFCGPGTGRPPGEGRTRGAVAGAVGLPLTRPLRLDRIARRVDSMMG